MKTNKMMKAFLMLIAVGSMVLALAGCGKKMPALDVNDPKSVAAYYAACIAQGEYDKAAGIAKRDGSEIVAQLKAQPDSKQSKEMIAAFQKIAESFDSVLEKTDKNEQDHKCTFRFNAKPIKKIGVRMDGGQYWVYDL